MMIYNIVALSQFSRLSTNYHSSHTLLTPKSAYHSLYVFFTYVFSFFSPFFSPRVVVIVVIIVAAAAAVVAVVVIFMRLLIILPAAH